VTKNTGLAEEIVTAICPLCPDHFIGDIDFAVLNIGSLSDQSFKAHAFSASIQHGHY
jgi:hypothetical protein